MSEPFIGQIEMFAGTFAPRSWAFCNGQLLAIAQNTALFSILGTTYGGDGRTSFALPDLRGRVPINSGGNSTGPGLSTHRLGSRSGLEENHLNVLQIPSHNHQVISSSKASELSGTIITGDANNLTDSPVNAYPANLKANLGGQDIDTKGYSGTAVGTHMAEDNVEVTLDTTGLMTGNTGSSQSIPNIQPYEAVNFIIALYGVFPSRN